ncbi:hypothetical protein JB92DRAFT_1688675 [Gautieria morchelliformis]|nr:hypothetical protein JB92DRAFT_1688675 [Gautieria morchelliformis]
MLEAIDVLKGVLGFEEYLPPQSRRHSLAPSDEVPGPPVAAPTPSDPPTTRPRSPSDPFLDTPALSHSLTTSTSRSPTLQSTTPLPGSQLDVSSAHATRHNLPGPPRRSAYAHKEPLDSEQDSVDEPYMRMWTSANLDNPELQSLISLFPDFIARHGMEVSCGTGRMYVGEKQRREGWKGSWWHRFTGWWRRLFS